MAKTKQQKNLELENLTRKFTKSKLVVFLQYLGLKVSEMQELRRKLRQADSDLVVAKKSLLGLMLEKVGLDKSKPKNMEGGVAVAFGYRDETEAAKTIADYAKKHEVIKFFGGVLEKEYIEADKVVALSQLPSRPELMARMVGSVRAPLSGLVNVLQGNLRGLVQVLNQIKEKKPV